MKTTTSLLTIDALRTVFAHNGLLTQIVSDNGPKFTSKEFAKFIKGNGIKHITSVPYNLNTNGLAERFVQSFNMSLKSSKKESGSVVKKLSNFLLAYRILLSARQMKDQQDCLWDRAYHEDWTL